MQRREKLRQRLSAAKRSFNYLPPVPNRSEVLGLRNCA